MSRDFGRERVGKLTEDANGLTIITLRKCHVMTFSAPRLNIGPWDKAPGQIWYSELLLARLGFSGGRRIHDRLDFNTSCGIQRLTTHLRP